MISLRRINFQNTRIEIRGHLEDLGCAIDSNSPLQKRQDGGYYVIHADKVVGLENELPIALFDFMDKVTARTPECKTFWGAKIGKYEVWFVYNGLCVDQKHSRIIVDTEENKVLHLEILGACEIYDPILDNLEVDW